ncbi:MAG: nitroreductase family protein [bacterium]
MYNTPFFKLVSERRSIRKFQNRPVEREKLLQCLEAARLAPSACNGQPWKFIAVDEPEIKKKLAMEAFSGIYSATMHAAEAPVLVAVVSEKRSFKTWAGKQITGTDFRLVDLGIACEHFVLQAAELGIGTCWLGWFDSKKAAAALKVPDGCKVEILISAGYSAQSPETRPRKRPEEMSSFNSF